MCDREPTIRGRELGNGVRGGMRAAGLSGKQVAARLGWTESQVSRVLVGRRSISRVDMSALLLCVGWLGWSGSG